MVFDFGNKKFDKNTTFVNPTLGDMGHPQHHVGATPDTGQPHMFRRGGVLSSKLDVSDVYASNYYLMLDIYSVTAQVPISFKAMLTQFNESFNTSLDVDVFVGHAEPVRRTKTIERVITIGLDIPAASVDEAYYNLSQIQSFVSCLHPVVEESKGTLGVSQRHVKAGGDPLFKVRFKNLIFDGEESSIGAVDQPRDTGMKGYIDNFQYSMDINAGFFNDRGNFHILYPKLIKASFTFFPFSEITPSWVAEPGKLPKFSHPFYPYGFGANMTEDEAKRNLEWHQKHKNRQQSPNYDYLQEDTTGSPRLFQLRQSFIRQQLAKQQAAEESSVRSNDNADPESANIKRTNEASATPTVNGIGVGDPLKAPEDADSTPPAGVGE